MKMRFDELFEMRKLTGTKLKDYIRSNGFSKVSFCKKTEISRPTLDKILNGEIDSKSTFDKHLNKILTSLSIDPDTLMGFSPRIQSADAVFSENAPIDYQVNDKAKMEYDLLQDMNAFQAPYKAVLISLYESAVKNGNTAIAEEVKENFDVQVEDIAQRFRDLGLDDSLVRPSYVVNVSPLQEKINKTIRNEPEVEYHKDNEAFLKTVLSEFKMLTGEADA